MPGQPGLPGPVPRGLAPTGHVSLPSNSSFGQREHKIMALLCFWSFLLCFPLAAEGCGDGAL